MSDVTYLSKYGGSVILTIIIIIAFLTLTLKHSIAGYVKTLKKRWHEIKCNPLIIPFAGYINAPQGTSKIEYTADNFTQCLHGILEDVTEVETRALRTTSSLMNDGIGDMNKAAQNTRELMSKIRNSAGGMFNTTHGKIFNVVTPLRQMLITSKDTLSKMQAIMTTNLYANIGVGISARSFAFMIQIALVVFVIFIIFIIVALIVVAFNVMFLGFWPISIPLGFSLLFGAVEASLLLFLTGMPLIVESIDNATDVIHATSSESLCFDENTPIYVKGEGEIKIKDVKLNDCLIDGGRVTALFKVANKNQEIYNLNDIIVSGRHMIECENNSFIETKDHKHSIKMENYTNPYLYCLNTTTKRIIIKTINFLDWDEIDYEDELILKNKTQVNKANIHKLLDSGLDGETLFEMEGGLYVPLKDVKVNDKLKDGEHVLGKVIIDSSNIDTIKKYNINETIIIGTPNNKIKTKDLGIITLSQIIGTGVNYKTKLYNIITDTKHTQLVGLKCWIIMEH